MHPYKINERIDEPKIVLPRPKNVLRYVLFKVGMSKQQKHHIL
jgi:hypothetical protein